MASARSDNPIVSQRSRLSARSRSSSCLPSSRRERRPGGVSNRSAVLSVASTNGRDRLASGRSRSARTELTDDSVDSTMPWKTARRRADTGGFVTRSQLLRSRKKERSRPTGMGGKTAGASSGLVYTTDTQNQRVKELLGLTKTEKNYLTVKKDMLSASLKRFQRIGLGYVEQPAHRTRSQLLEERRRAMLPPMSYDFNGDGVVDNFELFLGTRLDTNGDGEISATERARGRELLEDLKKNFTFGLDAAGANTQAYADIEQRAKRRQGSDGDDGQEALATFIAEKTAEAVVPPWAVTARRGFHESARSGYSQIGTAYYKDVLAQQRATQERRHTSSSHSKAARPQTGMSRLLGV